MGIKTGYTDAARHCLLFEAARNGRTLIGVVLGSPPTGVAAGAKDAEKMLNWGFRLPPRTPVPGRPGLAASPHPSTSPSVSIPVRRAHDR